MFTLMNNNNNNNNIPMLLLNQLQGKNIEKIFYVVIGGIPRLTYTELEAIPNINTNTPITIRKFTKNAIINKVVSSQQLAYNINCTNVERNLNIKLLFQNGFLTREELTMMFNLSYSRICEIVNS